MSEQDALLDEDLQSEELALSTRALAAVAGALHDEAHQGRLLRDYFLELDRGTTRLGVAGKIYSARAAKECMEAGFDYLSIGRGAVLHHDFPERVAADERLEMATLPVTRDCLRAEGLGEAFIDYMSTWDGFVAKP